MEILKIEDNEKLDRSFLTATETTRAMGISVNTFRGHTADLDFPIVRFTFRKSRFLISCGEGKAKKIGDFDFQPVVFNVLKICLNEGEVFVGRYSQA